MTFLMVWIGYTIVGVTIFSAVLVWAVRNRQFSDMDRGRYIALRLGTIDPTERPEESLVDRYALIALLALAFLVCVSAIFVGLRVR